jgi:hypothetical protein
LPQSGLQEISPEYAYYAGEFFAAFVENSVERVDNPPVSWKFSTGYMFIAKN